MKVFVCILETILLASYISVPTLSFIISSCLSYDFSFLNILGRNWVRSPYQSFSQDSCNRENYLVFSNWKGISEGCLCDDLIIKGGSCGNNNCKTIEQISEKNFTSWKNFSICTTYMNSSYLNLNISNTCSSLLKDCGVIDNLGNRLCLSNDTFCPVNSIGILNNNHKFSQIKSFKINQNVSFVFSNETNLNSSIPIEFTISQNHPCIDPSFDNRLTQKYPLERFYLSDVCFSTFENSLFNSNYNYLDSDTYSNIYQFNSLISSLTDLPKFNITSLNETTRLFYRNYIGLNFTCIKKIQNNNKQNVITQGLYYISQNLDRFLEDFNLLNYLVKAIWCFSAIIFYSRSRIVFSNHIDTRRKSVLNGIYIYSFLIFALFLVLFSINFSNFQKIQSSYFDFQEYISCGNPYFINRVNFFINTIDKVNDLLMTIVIILAVSLFLTINRFIYLLFLKLFGKNDEYFEDFLIELAENSKKNYHILKIQQNKENDNSHNKIEK